MAKIFSYALAAIIFLGIGASWIIEKAKNSHDIPHLKSVPDFSMINQEGESFSQDILLFVVTILILVSGFLIVQAVHFPRKKSIEIDRSRKDFIASFLNLIIGALGSSVGMVLGALRYPVMINFLKTEAKSAGAINSFAFFGLIGHLIASQESGNSHFDFYLFLPLAIAGFIGSYFGSKHVAFYSNKFILVTLYIILFIMGTLMVLREFL